MREAAKALKQGAAALIDGHLVFNAANVPLFDGKVEGNVNIYALMSIANETSENDTFNMGVSEMNLVFDIVSIRDATAKSEVLEEVSDQIRLLINPTKNATGFSLSAPFHLVMCEFATAALEDVKTAGTKFVHSKRISFRTIVTQ